MISAIDNYKNQYFERVGAVQFQTQRGYSAEFQRDLAQKIGSNGSIFDDNRIANTKFGSLLNYERTKTDEPNLFARNNIFSPLHPDVRDENRAKEFDFLA